MTDDNLILFWNGIASRLRESPRLWKLEWRPLGGMKRAYGANTNVTGIRYRFLIRRGDVGAVELQIDCPDADRNKRNLKLLSSHKSDIELGFVGQLLWNADLGNKNGRRRCCLRYCVPDGKVGSVARDWGGIQKDMVSAMERMIKVIDPYLPIFEH